MKTSTNVPVKLSVILTPIARTPMETTRVVVGKDTTEMDIRVSAVNVRTLSVLIIRSAYRQELKSANVKKVFTSTLNLLVFLLW